MAISVGSVSIDIVPVASTFARDIRKKLLPAAVSVGKEMGTAIAEEVGKALKDAPEKSPTEQYRKQGAKDGGAYASSLKKAIETAVKSMPDIEIDADSTDAQREIALIRKQMAELGDKRIGIDLDASAAEAQLEGFRKRLATLANSEDVTIDVKADTAAAAASLDKFRVEAARVRDIKVNVDADTGGASAKLAAFQAKAQLIRDVKTTVDLDIGAALGKIALVNAGLLAIPAAAGGAAYSIGSIGAALAPAVGLIGLMPAGILGVGIAFGALKVATSGVGDAIKNAFDPTKAKQFQKALAKLSPQAKTFVLDLQAMGPALNSFKMATQDALFTGLGPMLQSLGSSILPIVKDGFVGIASSANTAALGVGGVLQSYEGMSALRTVVESTKVTFDNLSQVVAPLTYAFLQIGAIGAPILAELTQGAGDVAQRFAAWVGSAEGINTIRDWIWGAISVVGDLLIILRNVALAFGSLFTAANAAGANFLSTLIRITGAISDFLRSAEGQNALAALFTNIRAAVDAAMPGLQNILSAIGYLITSLAPVLPQVGAAFSAVVGAARPLFDILVSLAAAVLPPFLWLITQFPGVFIGLVAAVWLVVQAFSALKVIIAVNAAIQAAAAIPAMAAMATSVWGAVTATWAWTAALLANPITWVVLLIVALVAAVIYAWNNFEWFRNIVIGAWSGIQAAASWCWSILQVVFAALWTAIQAVGGFFVWLWQSVVVPAWNAIAGAISWAWTTILEPIFTAIWTVLKFIGAIIFVVLVTPFVIAWNLISAAVVWAWDNVLQPIWNALVWFIQNVIAPAVSWLYNNIFKPIWDAIGAAVSWVWNNIIKPVYDALVFWQNNVVAPALTWLYWNVFKPIWDAIGAAIVWVWNNIIKPVYDALVFFQNNIMAPALTWLYWNVIKPIWDAIGAAISFIWNSIILPVYNALVYFQNNIMAPAIQWLYNNIIKPVWDAIGNAIKWVWENVISPAFNAVWGGLQWLGDRFVDATNRIRDIWNMIKGFLAKPINFLIDTVWNHGIVPVWNAVAGLVGIGGIAPYPLIPEFATGGAIDGPGSGTSDSILARVSNGEFVIREKVAKKATPFLNALNQGDGEALQAAGATRAGRSPKFRGESGLGMDPMTVVPKFATGGLIDQRIAAAKQWLSTDARGIPYVWGGGGKGGMDCSGMQAAVTHVLSGRSPYSGRIGTTGSMPWGGFVGGLNGQYAVGNKPNDHMAGTLAGQNVEQHGPSGTPFSFPSRWGADNGYFPQKFHLAEVGGNFVSGGAGGGGGGFNPIRWAIEKAFGAVRDPLVNGIRAFTGPPPPAWRDAPPNLAGKSIDTLRDFLLAKADSMFGGGGGAAMGATSDEAPGIVRIISDVAKGRFGGLAKQAATIGTATGLVESNLRNLAGGDRDSVGVFQQRPSQGWGSVAECRNVTHAAGMFFSRFPGGWAGMDPGAVAQSVQRSAFPGRYSQRMGQAAGLVNQFGGFDSGGLATGKGLMPKGIVTPERVLSTQQTRSFDTLVRNLDTGRTSATEPAGGSFTGNLYLDSGEFMGKVHGAINSADDNAARQLTYGRS